jgi:REP element-mobilizing transposase RayT
MDKLPYDATKHHRRSIRLPDYDYTSPGTYFVTICVQGGECLLGQIVDGEMQLNERGQIAAASWEWLGAQYPYVSLDAWVIMPNHMHGIIVVQDDDAPTTCRGGSRTAPTRTAPADATPTERKPLGRLVGAFKTVSTKRINQLRDTPGVPFWQRNYWEHISRNGQSLNRIREYIDNNPARWPEDQLHPDALPNQFNQWQP